MKNKCIKPVSAEDTTEVAGVVAEEISMEEHALMVTSRVTVFVIVVVVTMDGISVVSTTNIVTCAERLVTLADLHGVRSIDVVANTVSNITQDLIEVGEEPTEESIVDIMKMFIQIMCTMLMMIMMYMIMCVLMRLLKCLKI